MNFPNKIVIVFLATVILLFNSSCSEDINDEMNGYWISVDYSFDRDFTTLFINDSVFIENPFGIYRYELYVKHHESYHEVLYPFDSWITAGFITIKNDTLTFIKGSQQDTLKCIRFNPELLNTDLSFSEFPIKISLPQMADGQYVSFAKKWLYEPVLIGKLKSGLNKNHQKIKRDSILIQVDDIFISVNDLSKWIDGTKAKVDEFDRNEIIISLYADVDIPDSFLNEIKDKVKENGLRVGRAYKNPVENKIYFKMLD